jgi:hypothetical protein
MFPELSEVELTPVVIAIIIAIEVALIAIGIVLVWAIIKVRNQPAPAMLTVTLGLLTLVCILGYILSNSNVLGTLAATGLGALAGSLTNVLQVRNDNKEGGADGRPDRTDRGKHSA